MTGGRADQLEWRYLAGGTVSHGLTRSSNKVSICNTYAAVWFGTGNQREYEKVAALPRCKRCLRLAAR